MKKYYPGIFCSDWMGESISWDQNAEDVCFFKNEKLILGTVSHERICLVFPPLDNSSFEKEIQNILRKSIENKPQMHCFEDTRQVTESHPMGQIGG